MREVSKRSGSCITNSLHKLVFALFVLCFSAMLPAARFDYKISSMALKIADLSIDLNSDKITVEAQNQGRMSIFPHLNNSYEIWLDEDLRPKTYLRMIHQGELRDSVLTVYEHSKASLHKQSSEQILHYELPADSRDFFSFLYILCQSPNPAKSYLLDDDGQSWKAEVSPPARERIRTPLGKMYARRHDIQMLPLCGDDAEYVDMLTHNFFDENLDLVIWISDNGVPLKAKIKKGLLSMSWEIIGIR